MYLTRRQKEIFDFLRQYRTANGISPTLDEIADAFSVSKVTVFEHVRALEEKGLLRKTRHHARSIELIPQPPPPVPASRPRILHVLGTVAAGQPIEALEDPQTLDVNELFSSTHEGFVLRVRGNSMIGEQIRDGDYVLVERRTTPQQGETVVAILNGNEATLKKFYREQHRIRLEPANPDLEPIYSREVEIKGVVVGVIRKYR